MPCISTVNFMSRGNEHCRASGGISGYVETMSTLRPAVPFLLHYHHVPKCYINPYPANVENMVSS